MDKSKRDLYITEILIIVLYVLFKLFITNYYFSLLQYFDLVFFGLCFGYLFFKYGIAREKNYLTRLSVRYVIIALLAYVIIIYVMGCFTGFTKSIYDMSIIGIIRNALAVIIAVIFKELIRFCVAYNSKKNVKPIIILTIVYILIEIFNSALYSSFATIYLVFHFVCLSVVPVVAKNALLSYMTYNINFIPSMIYALAFEVAPFVLPIYPDLGDYLNSVLGVLFPFVLYTVMRKLVTYNEKEVAKVRGYVFKIMMIPLLLFLIVLAILVSGIFRYKMIAIASDSMNPIYYRGDAIIYEKVQAEDIEQGDILVFEYNHIIVTHRVISITEENGHLYFQTKGDNNDEPDNELISEDDVLGKVVSVIKYIGYPTVWFNEQF